MNNSSKNTNVTNLKSQIFDWKVIQTEMKNKIGIEVYESWLKKIDFLEEFNNYILLSVPTRFIRDWITSRYLDQILQVIKLYKKDRILCAKYRKGHFEGVIDVMDRLINIIKPKNIYMGEKDFQQLYLVKKFIQNKYVSKIILCKTIRDKNKLALSSRNLLLNKNQLKRAGKLSQKIISLKKKLSNIKNIQKYLMNKKKEFNKLFNINIEYLELRKNINLNKTNKIKNAKIFIAYYIGKVRLIDNF